MARNMLGVMVDYHSIYLGRHNVDETREISKEVEYLVRRRCKDQSKFIEIKRRWSGF